MSAETVIEDIIGNAQTIANQTIEAAIGYADDAQTAAATVTSLTEPQRPDKPVVVVPPVSPDNNSVYEYSGAFDDIYNQLGPDFAGKFQAFIDTYFPKIDECLRDNIDDWICDVVLNGTTGIPPNVASQIWERMRANELNESFRQENQVVSAWADRGFSLPQGALYAAQQDIQEQASVKISTGAREIAIKEMEIQIDTIKFAVEQGVKLRLGALQAAIDYFRAWVGLASAAIDYATGLSNARLKLYDATSAYYSALISAARLTYDWGRDYMLMQAEENKTFVNLVNANTATRVQAALSAASSVASVGAAAASAMNTLANIGNNTVISSS